MLHFKLACMSIIPPHFAALRRFYRSMPSPCPYIPGQIERKLFTRLDGNGAAELNATLTKAGFRRSHDIVYRPVCPACQACVPVRIPAAAFLPSRTQKRILKRNADLTLVERPAIASEEQYQLFSTYQRGRHAEGDMARMSFLDFRAMIQDGSADSRVLELRDGRDHLIGAMLVDTLADGLSAVYSFFDPAAKRRSLGTFIVLAAIEMLKMRKHPFLYLGYWIAKSRKMAYKAGFQPLQKLGPAGWVSIEPTG
jgi:arginyl-tRNA--protein-N-Asp/Glu arginylyltransferase